MANRYWVGGSGNWDATTTHWSATSGGASGASVPTSVDDVFFDTLSNATLYTVTLTTNPNCRSVTIGAPLTGAVTIAGSAAWGVYGSFTLAATGITWTYTGGLFFNATTTGWTITTNGVSLTTGVSFNGAGGGWTLGGAFTSTSGINALSGTFNTGNFNVTLSSNFTLTGALARTVNLGSSAISCLTWNALGATNLTVNAGTSTITLTQAAGTFNGGGLTYYNVFKAQNGIVIGDGGNTFNALTNAATGSGGTFVCSFAGSQTIGTLTVNGGSAANSRASIQTPSTLAGTQVTLTVASFMTNGNIDFRDINFQGAASPLTVSTGGDAGNNTNITLATPKTVYWSLAAGGTWNANTAWATTSGGAPSLANYPLPQDTAIIENTGLNSGASIGFANNPSLGTVNISNRTLPMTLSLVANASNIYGNLTLSSAVTVTATTGSLTFSGYNKTQTITSATVSFANAFIVNNPTVTVTLADNLTTTSATAFSVLSGALNLNGKTLSSSLFSSTGALVRSIAFNGGTIAVSGATFTASGTNLTTTGTGTISMTSASSKTFAGGGFSYPTLSQDGAGALVITGANTFRTIANTVAPATITLPASTTTSIAGFDLVGTAGNLITLNSSTSGTQATINNTTGGRIGGDYLSYKDTNATPANTISAGANSTSVSNNTGWLTTPVVFGATAESITFADTQDGIRGQFANTADAITLTDSDVSQIAFAPTVAEPLTLATVESAQAAFKPTNAEVITFTDSQSSQVSFVSAATDTITFTDAQAGVRGQFGSVSDAIALTDASTAQMAWGGVLAENVNTVDAVYALAVFVPAISETIVYIDSAIQRGWIKINNSQTSNWTSVINGASYISWVNNSGALVQWVNSNGSLVYWDRSVEKTWINNSGALVQWVNSSGSLVYWGYPSEKTWVNNSGTLVQWLNNSGNIVYWDGYPQLQTWANINNSASTAWVPVNNQQA